MILTEYGLHFAKDRDHPRCAGYPDLLMLPRPERYRVGDRTSGSLDEALRHLEARGSARRGVEVTRRETDAMWGKAC